ncbi:MAG TPA: glucan biosynthesis protein D [Myxococcota bacterium]|nr:glucan biosynthesis protein D [Myxococcota bacterium]
MKSSVVAVLLALVAAPASAARLGPKQPFDYAAVIEKARAAAKKPYVKAPDPHAEVLATITGEVANRIYFDHDKALWVDVAGAPKIEFFHRNTYFREKVRMYVVESGQAREVLYDTAMYDYGASRLAKTLPEDLGFAGFRVMNPHNAETDWLAYLGASYFRAATPFDQYGISARAIAIDSGFKDEEHPRYTDVWFEQRGADLRITAYVDGPSVAGVVRFDVHVAGDAIMDVQANYFARKDVRRLGLAPLTSMYWYGERDRRYITDWHPEVHDSDVLVIQTAGGEQIARPLQNPKLTVTSTFDADDVRGFGLLQRDRDPEHYLDEIFHYERRPNLWVEPTKPFGKGKVMLLELATAEDVNDNTVAFWVPAAPVKAGASFALAYKLHWTAQQPRRPPVAEVRSTRVGWGGSPPAPNVRRFAVELEGGLLEKLPADATVVPVVTVARGTVERPQVTRVGDGKRWRAQFDLREPGDAPVDIRMFLKSGTQVLSETWLYQYRPGDDG